MADHAMTVSRDGVHSETHWWAGAFAGIIAGVAFVMLEMALVRMVHGESPWGPPRMMAAMVLGKGVLPEPGIHAPFSMSIIAVAMMVHMMLSIALGLIGAWLIHRFDWGQALAIGAVFGLAIYVVNFYLIAPAAFPWFGTARNATSAFSHAMFGAVLGLAYVWLRRPKAVDPSASRLPAGG